MGLIHNFSKKLSYRTYLGMGYNQCCGSRIRNRLLTDPGFQPHFFESLVTIFQVKSTIFVATRKGLTNYFYSLLFCCCFWIQDSKSGIRDMRSEMDKNKIPWSRINIPKHPGSATLVTTKIYRYPVLLFMSHKKRTKNLNKTKKICKNSLV